MHVENEDFERTIAIPTMGVRTTEFDLSPARRDALYDSGVRAAEEFFKTWSFPKYVRRRRAKRDPAYVRKIEKMKADMVG
jgi:NTE family protein